MTYDDVEWHTDSVDDLDLADSAAATHIGMFLAWTTARELLADTFRNRIPATEAVAERTITPSALARKYFVAQIDPSMLNDVGNRFTTDAYSRYLSLLSEIPPFSTHETIYHIPDTWAAYDQIAPHLDEIYTSWRALSA